MRMSRFDVQPSEFPLIDMSYGSVILSETYSELSLMLPTDRIYGQGGADLSFRSPGKPANYSKYV